jgi:hypothetical protein
MRWQQLTRYLRATSLTYATALAVLLLLLLLLLLLMMMTYCCSATVHKPVRCKDVLA